MTRLFRSFARLEIWCFLTSESRVLCMHSGSQSFVRGTCGRRCLPVLARLPALATVFGIANAFHFDCVRLSDSPTWVCIWTLDEKCWKIQAGRIFLLRFLLKADPVTLPFRSALHSGLGTRGVGGKVPLCARCPVAPDPLVGHLVLPLTGLGTFFRRELPYVSLSLDALGCR